MPFAGPTPALTHVADLHINVRPGVLGGSTPLGDAVWISSEGGFLHSTDPASPDAPQLQAEILPGSADYCLISAATEAFGPVLRMNIQMASVDKKTNDLFRFANTGFIHITPEIYQIMTGAEGARSTEFGEFQVVQHMTVSTSSKQWYWLNFATLIGQGRMVVKDRQLVQLQFRIFSADMKGGI